MDLHNLTPSPAAPEILPAGMDPRIRDLFGQRGIDTYAALEHTLSDYKHAALMPGNVRVSFVNVNVPGIGDIPVLRTSAVDTMGGAGSLLDLNEKRATIAVSDSWLMGDRSLLQAIVAHEFGEAAGNLHLARNLSYQDALALNAAEREKVADRTKFSTRGHALGMSYERKVAHGLSPETASDLLGCVNNIESRGVAYIKSDPNITQDLIAYIDKYGVSEGYIYRKTLLERADSPIVSHYRDSVAETMYPAKRNPYGLEEVDSLVEKLKEPHPGGLSYDAHYFQETYGVSPAPINSLHDFITQYHNATQSVQFKELYARELAVALGDGPHDAYELEDLGEAVSRNLARTLTEVLGPAVDDTRVSYYATNEFTSNIGEPGGIDRAIASIRREAEQHPGSLLFAELDRVEALITEIAPHYKDSPAGQAIIPPKELPPLPSSETNHAELFGGTSNPEHPVSEALPPVKERATEPGDPNPSPESAPLPEPKPTTHSKHLDLFDVDGEYLETAEPNVAHEATPVPTPHRWTPITTTPHTDNVPTAPRAVEDAVERSMRGAGNEAEHVDQSVARGPWHGKLAIIGALVAAVGLGYALTKKKTVNERHQNLESPGGQRLKAEMDLPYKDHSVADALKALTGYAKVTKPSLYATDALKAITGHSRLAHSGVARRGGALQDILRNGAVTTAPRVRVRTGGSFGKNPVRPINMVAEDTLSAVNKNAGKTMRTIKEVPATVAHTTSPANFKPARFNATVTSTDMPMTGAGDIYARHTGKGLAY